MTTGANDVWVFRIVHQDTGKPAQACRDRARSRRKRGGPLGERRGRHRRDPRRDTVKLRLRVGLRSEDPIELATATLGEGPTPLAAPTQLPTIGSIGHVGERPARDAPAAQPRPLAPPSSQKYRGTSSTSSGWSCSPSAPLRRVLPRRVGQRGAPSTSSRRDRRSVGDALRRAGGGGGILAIARVLWGELLYSVTLTPGDEAKLAVLDGRWRRETEGRERPLQILARMVGTSMFGDLITSLRPSCSSTR